MSRKLFVLPLLLALAAGAEQPKPGSFSAQTLGQAAAHSQDLNRPMTLSVEIKLSGPVRDIGPLVSYLRAHGFEVSGQITQAAGPEPKSLFLVGKKTEILSSDAINVYEREIRALVPKDLNVNWRMEQTKLDS